MAKTGLLQTLRICAFLSVSILGLLAQKFPDQVHIALSDEPDTITVTWSTSEDVQENMVEYGPIREEIKRVVRATPVVPLDAANGTNVENNRTVGAVPETKESIAGQTKVEVAESKNAPVEVSTEPVPTEPPQEVYRAEGTCSTLVPGIIIAKKQFVHKVKLINLEPKQKYWYRCGGPQNGWSRNFTFKTIPSGSDWSPRLAVYGDLGQVNGKILDRLIKEAGDENLDAVLHAGDLAYDLHMEEGNVGDRFLRQIEPLASNVPYMVCPGNHESFKNFSNYKTRFWMPGDHENMMYTFKLGPLLIISVSTEVYYFLEYGGVQPISWQYTWLENVLKEANRPENRRKQPWIMVMGHRPMYCSNNVLRNCAAGNTRVRDGGTFLRGKGLEKLFYDYGVDLIFWGHQHSYERLWPVYDKEIYNGSNSDPYVNPRAPVHFIVGCAGNQEARHRFLKTLPKWSAFRSLIYGFVHLTVANKTHAQIRYESHDYRSPTVDNIWVIKDAHGPYPRLFPLDGPSRGAKSLQQKGKKRKLKILG